MTKIGCIVSGALVAAALAGCYKEPVSADKTVRPEERIYLKNTSLALLTVNDVYGKGLVFMPDAGCWTNLSARFESIDAFKPASVDYLNLDYNSLTNVDAVAGFTSLKWLRLNSNKLAALPDLSALADLRKIYLRRNFFTTVPSTLRDMPLLTDIDMSENPMLKEIPGWLAEKTGLEHLSFSSTSITRLPADLTAWKTLKTLQLGNLKLTREEMDRVRAALPETAVVF